MYFNAYRVTDLGFGGVTMSTLVNKPVPLRLLSKR